MSRICTVADNFSYEAYRTDIDSPTGNWLKSAMNRAFEEDPVLLRLIIDRDLDRINTDL